MKVSRRKSIFPRFKQRLTMKKIGQALQCLTRNVSHDMGYVLFIQPGWAYVLKPDELNDLGVKVEIPTELMRFEQ
jgi:hypothetical protein